MLLQNSIWRRRKSCANMCRGVCNNDTWLYRYWVGMKEEGRRYVMLVLRLTDVRSSTDYFMLQIWCLWFRVWYVVVLLML